MRKLESDLSLLYDEDAVDHPAYPSFVRQMEGREYGEDPLNEAWEWFRAGWDAHIARQLEREVIAAERNVL